MTDVTAYGQSWYAATMLETAPRPSLAVDLDVDVCVIGGGLAGLTTAREVARAGWSVVVLEATRLAAQASGRNTGFVLPGFAADAERLIARVGFARTKSLWALAQAGLDYVRHAAFTEGVTGIDPEPGWLYVSKIDNGDELLRFARLLSDLGCDVESWPTERVRAVLHSDRYFHAINYLQAITIHPVNYALTLAAAAERDGARIFENTPALSIDPAGVRKRVATPDARVRASHVVVCGNVQIGDLVPLVASTLIPVTTYLIATAPLGPRLAEVVGYRGGISDSDLSDNHYRIVDRDRLLLSGRATSWARSPARYVGALTAAIKRIYPQLGEVTADYSWSGTLGNTIHRMPQIGEFGPGVWLASGFGGHGLNTTAMAGNLIARAIVNDDQTWRQFAPFELVWAGGVFGRVTVQTRLWLKRMRDAVAQRRARRREFGQRRAVEAELVLEAERVQAAALAAERAEEERAAQKVQTAPAPAPQFELSPQESTAPLSSERSSDDAAPAASDGMERSAEEPPAGKRGKRRRRREPAKALAQPDRE